MLSIGGDYGSAAPNTLGVPNMGPPGAAEMDPRKKAIVMAMMQQQMQKQGPQQGMAMPPPRPRQQFDMYGNPVL